MWEELPKYPVCHGFSHGFMLIAAKHIFAKEVVSHQIRNRREDVVQARTREKVSLLRRFVPK